MIAVVSKQHQCNYPIISQSPCNPIYFSSFICMNSPGTEWTFTPLFQIKLKKLGILSIHLQNNSVLCA